MKLLVLDGNSLVNRAYFGIKLLTTKDGRYTNAIFGFQNILLNLLSAHHPDAVAIAWDEKAPTFRHTAYDGYKATRHGMPQELAEQMPVLKQLLTDLGFVQVSKPGWEADDILLTPNSLPTFVFASAKILFYHTPHTSAICDILFLLLQSMCFVFSEVPV